ncbi:MAG: hypothetical protein AUI14_01570 [Actinobacteria bacterium 13_2_20CM_2_71_6]|nr:MAG: hypothetical protein AUI14_01570 [Actinobacteria bacterium 13_2_20CM_2_71_6]
MSFRSKLNVDGATATIRLAGELSSESAEQLNRLVGQAAGEPVQRLVLLMAELTYMSSAGLRCLVFAHQKLGPDVEIVLVGARPEIADTIKLTGLDRGVVMQDPVVPGPADA